MTVEIQNRVKSCKSDKAISFVGFCVDVKLGKIRFFKKCTKESATFCGVFWYYVYNFIYLLIRFEVIK